MMILQAGAVWGGGGGGGGGKDGDADLSRADLRLLQLPLKKYRAVTVHR